MSWNIPSQNDHRILSVISYYVLFSEKIEEKNLKETRTLKNRRKENTEKGSAVIGCSQEFPNLRKNFKWIFNEDCV